jgi:hypothetical protein
MYNNKKDAEARANEIGGVAFQCWQDDDHHRGYPTGMWDIALDNVLTPEQEAIEREVSAVFGPPPNFDRTGLEEVTNLSTGLSRPEWDTPTDAETDALDRDFD